MQLHKKFSARFLSLVLSVAMVTTLLPMTVFAAESDASADASAIGTIESFDQLEDRLIPSVGEDAPSHVYGLSVSLDTPVDDLNLPGELTAMVARAAMDEETTVTTTEREIVPVAWVSDREYVSTENGQFIYTAELPEGYILADGVDLPQIYVLVGIQARDARANGVITVEIIDTNDIPATASGVSLMDAIGTSSIGATNVRSLKIIEGTFTTADWKALLGLSSMTSFEIGDAVAVELMPAATEDTSIFPKSIETVVVSKADVTLQAYAFNNCTALKSAHFPYVKKITNGVFRGCTSLTDISMPQLQQTAKNSFEGCTSLKVANFPALKSMGFMFRGCSKLETLNFPLLETLGMGAFDGCTSLKSATFPSAKKIYAGFAGCNQLATLKLGATPPLSVDANAFDDCPNNRTLGYVAADGTELTGDDLTAAQTAYRTYNDGDTTDNLWYGWKITPAVSLPDYTGIEAAAPSSTPSAKTAVSITLVPVTVTGETIEYVYSTSATAPTTGWQDSTAFTGLTADTQYYFFARVKANTTHNAGTASTGTAIKTDKSDAQKAAAAKVLAEAALDNLTATNATTAAGILSAVNTAITSVTGVTATWKAAPTITAATDSAAGSITGTIVLTCGSATVEVTVNKTIAQLGSDAEKVANAKAAAVAALNSYTATNATADSDIMALVNTAIADAGITGITAAWKSGSGFDKTNATASATGSVTGTITLTLNSAEQDVVVNLAIAQLSTYTVTVSGGGTGATASGASYAAGDTVSISAGAKSGYTFSGWTAAPSVAFASAGSSSTTFVMPASSVTVTANWSSTGGGSTGGGGDSSSGNTGSSVTVDGKTESIGKVETSGSTTTVVVDSAKLDSKVSSAKDGSSVVIPVSTAKDSAAAQLVVESVEKMATKDMTLEVKAGKTTYALPAAAIDTDSVLAQLGATDAAKVPFTVTITDEKNVKVEGSTMVLPAMSFTISASYDGKTVTVDRFDTMVARTIEVSRDQASKITTAVVVEQDGSLRHVPTAVYERGGKWYAEINSLTNSIYTLITNESKLTDVSGKWYEAAANELSAREITDGVFETVFEGEKAITRAEFAALIVNALGLPKTDNADFSDVSAEAWYSKSVATAAEYGIVKGRSDETFAPSATITRQEAMVMIQRAASVVDYTGGGADNGTYTDRNLVGAWAADGVAFNLANGMIVGNNGKIDPTGTITRAETATVLLRLLQRAELVDVRAEV